MEENVKKELLSAILEAVKTIDDGAEWWEYKRTPTMKELMNEFKTKISV